VPFKLEIVASNPFELERDLITMGEMARSFAYVRSLANNARAEQQQKGVLTEEAQTAVAANVGDAQPPDPAPVEPEKPKGRGRPAKPRTIVDTGSGGVPMPPEPLDPKLAEPPAPAASVLVEEDPLEVPAFLKKEKQSDVDVPKDMAELRQRFVDLVNKKGAAAVDEIVIKKLGYQKLKEVPTERFGEAARLIAEAMAA